MKKQEYYHLRDAEIVVHCSSDICYASISSYYLLVQRGFKNVRRYAGGLLDWQKEGYPLGTGSDRTASGQQAITRVGPALAPVAKPTGASPPR